MLQGDHQEEGPGRQDHHPQQAEAGNAEGKRHEPRQGQSSGRAQTWETAIRRNSQRARGMERPVGLFLLFQQTGARTSNGAARLPHHVPGRGTGGGVEHPVREAGSTVRPQRVPGVHREREAPHVPSVFQETSVLRHDAQEAAALHTVHQGGQVGGSEGGHRLHDGRGHLRLQDTLLLRGRNAQTAADRSRAANAQAARANRQQLRQRKRWASSAKQTADSGPGQQSRTATERTPRERKWQVQLLRGNGPQVEALHAQGASQLFPVRQERPPRIGMQGHRRRGPEEERGEQQGQQNGSHAAHAEGGQAGGQLGEQGLRPRGQEHRGKQHTLSTPHTHSRPPF